MDDLNEQNNENIDIDSNELTIGNIINNSFSIAFANIGLITLMLLVYYLTIWIPYINLGTSIAMFAFCIAIVRNKPFRIEELFSYKYRKLIGTMLLLHGISFLAILLGLLWFIVPGLVLMLAWGQAGYLVVDKNLGPMDALKTSYNITYGKKWIIFFSFVVIAIIQEIIGAIIRAIVWAPGIMTIGVIGEVLFIILFTSVWISGSGYIFNQLSRDI